MAYYDAVSPAWHDAMQAKGHKISFYEAFDFCVTVWVLYPLLLLKGIEKDNKISLLSEKLMGTVINVIESWDRLNMYVSEAMGTWQYTSMLHDLFKIGVISGYKPAVDRVIQQVDEILLPFAESIAFLFPLSFDTRTLKKYGNGDNYAIAGLFASLMLSIHEYTADEKYKKAAASAINVLYNLPANSSLQESFLTSYGVISALQLYTLTSNDKYIATAKYLLAQNLRLAYWYNDRTGARFDCFNLLGMFQACTPMLYPAFLENSMCLTVLSGIFRHMVPQKGLLRLFNLGRINNFYMFPKCMPEKYHITKSLYIPYENLGTLEDDKMGYVGQEIYGSGGVFWFYMLWEAFAVCDNKDIMVMALDLFKDNTPDASLTNSMFIVYNPLEEAVDAKIRFNHIKQGAYALTGIDPLSLNSRIELDGDLINIPIKPDEYVYVKIMA